MECNRKNCDNIMCAKGSSEYGYICDECFAELGTRMFESLKRDGAFANIKVFMNSDKNAIPLMTDDYIARLASEYLNKEFI